MRVLPVPGGLHDDTRACLCKKPAPHFSCSENGFLNESLSWLCHVSSTDDLESGPVSIPDVFTVVQNFCSSNTSSICSPTASICRILYEADPFSLPTPNVKVTGGQYDMLHKIFIQLYEYLVKAVPEAEFASLVPPLNELVHSYHLEPEVHFPRFLL